MWHGEAQKVLAGAIHAAEKSPKMAREPHNKHSQCFQRKAENWESPLQISLPSSGARMKIPKDPDEHHRRATQNQMHEQNAFEFLAFKLELPSEKTSPEHRQHGNRCAE